MKLSETEAPTVQEANRFSPRYLRAAGLGLVFALVTILFGQGLGIAFGLNEEAIKRRLRSDAQAVEQTQYRGDREAMDAVLDKSWTYMKRAHLHATSLGATALGLVLLLGLLEASSRGRWLISLGLGLGGLGYSIFWMWAGFRAPGLGGTAAAKESLAWLAIPSSGVFVLATVAVLVLLIRGVGHGGARDL